MGEQTMYSLLFLVASYLAAGHCQPASVNSLTHQGANVMGYESSKKVVLQLIMVVFLRTLFFSLAKTKQKTKKNTMFIRLGNVSGMLTSDAFVVQDF